MIYALNVPRPTHTHIPWWEKVEALKNPRVFEFRPGLNILWGPNGSGKSTVIKALARYFHCVQSGMPVLTEHSINELNEKWSFKGNSEFANLNKNFQVKHDGQPVRHFDPSVAVGLIGGMSAFDWDFGAAGIQNAMFKGSSGQTGLYRFDKLGMSIKNGEVPTFERKLGTRLNDLWQARVDTALNLLKPTPGVEIGQLTVLLDEPERSFDLQLQLAIWRFIRAYSHTIQFIVASHSMFALNLPEANYIEMTPGYLDLSREIFKALLAFPTETPIPKVEPQPKPQRPKTIAKKRKHHSDSISRRKPT